MKPLFEESEHAVARLLGRMPLVIDELLGDDAVRHAPDSPWIAGPAVFGASSQARRH